MSTTFTLRLPKELLRRMREKRDINWAEVLRDAIRRTLNEPILPVAVENFIRSLRDSGEWELLRCLYLKADLLNERYAIKNLEIIYPGKAAEILDQLDSLLKENGFNPDLSGSFEGQPLRDLFKNGLLTYGVYDKFEEDLRRKLEAESWEVKEAAWLLSQYFIEDPYRDYEYSIWVEPHGFTRALGIILDREDVLDVINRLVEIGLVFWDLYSSRAFFHEMIVGADYARSLFIELSTQEGYWFQGISTSLLKNPDFMAFLKWLSSHGLEFRPVVEYEEEKAKREFKGSRPFDEVLAELVKRGVVLIDYWPHRRRAGKRSSRPPYWVYRLTPVAKRKLLPRLLTECLSKLNLRDLQQ